jgi:uncharacterized protein YceH (UPF0502 family)
MLVDRRTSERPAVRLAAIALTGLAVLALGGCAGAASDVDTGTAALEERIAALEVRLAELEGPDTPEPASATEPTPLDRVGALDDAFDALAARVDVLAEDLGEEGAARTLADAEASAATRALDQRLRTLVGELDALRAELESLRNKVDKK